MNCEVKSNGGIGNRKTWLCTVYVGIKKIQLCAVGIVSVCSYSEISTCGLDLGLGVLASFNIIGDMHLL